MSDNLLTVLVVEPAKPPYVKQIPDTLQAMQEIVGGNIDATYPFEDPVALVFNSEGKFSDLQPNRLLRLENGVLQTKVNRKNEKSSAKFTRPKKGITKQAGEESHRQPG